MKCNYFRIKLSSWRWVIVLSLIFLPSVAEAIKIQAFNWNTSGDPVQYVVGTGRTSGRIWGSGVYTNDSDIWTAAVHAGVLSSGQVGVIKVTALPGQSSYQGSTSNGVTTASYGNWSGSFSVSRWNYNGEPIDDPTNLFYWRGMSGTYNFSLVGTSNGGVWGTDTYTDDSLLAKAAVHAGKLAVGQSGVVAVTLAPGQSSYVGSTRNGVSTSSYGSFAGSYNFGTVSSTYTITTAASPTAGGSVTCNPNPVSLDSSSTCTATANSGYTFASWSGDCSSTTSTCTLGNVTAQKSVTAVFNLVATPTASTIFDNFNTGGVSNGPSSQTAFSVSSTMNITEVTTYHWNNGSGSTPGTISLKHSDGTVYGPWTASFSTQGARNNTYWTASPNASIKAGSYTVIDSNTATWSYNSTSGNAGFVLVRGDVVTTSNYTISTAASPAAGGTITSSPAGIDCGATCSASLSGTVTLTATPASGSFFFGWSGACSGAGSCVVTMSEARNVTATFKPKPFVATTTSTITATSATISTTVSFAPADVGKSGAVYVTAWAPASGLAALGILSAPMSHALSVTATNDNPYSGGKINTRQETLAAILAAADPNAFVLVQLTSSGWQLVQNGQLIPYASGVLGDSMSAMSILNNANPANLTGAQFCVGYGTSAAEMIAAGRMIPVADIPGATVATNGSCNVAANPYKGLWWNPAESGWGMSVTQHDNINFVALYTYDQSAQPVWYVMSNCPLATAGSCTGDLYKVTGGTPPGVAWNGTGKVVSVAGSGTLTFSDANHGKFDFTLNGVAGSKTIERQQFSSGTAAQALDYTDLWWNANESGWGVALTQDMGMLFAAWYTYDAAGLPVWYVASSCPLSGSGCTGDVYKVTGGTVPTSPWAPNLAVTPVGSVTFSFSDSGTGTMSYTIDGVAGSRAITRQAF